MADFITTKYGTKINVKGLTPEQVKQVRSTAEDKGAYGTKGAALADTFRKQAGKTPREKAAGNDLGIGKRGNIDAQHAIDTVTDAVKSDDSKNFNINNPGSQTDEFGNSQNISIDPVTGQVTVNRTGGENLTAANKAFMGAIGSVGQGKQSVMDANYKYITRDYADQKAQEFAAKKQELAEQGIPMGDPNDPNSRYNKELTAINKRFDTLNDQANQQAIISGDQSYATDVNAAATLGNTAQGQAGNFTPYAGGSSNQGDALMQLLDTLSDAELTKYGINKDFKAKLKAIAASRSGGGSSGGGMTDGNTDHIGGMAPT